MSEHVLQGLSKLQDAFDKTLKEKQLRLYEVRLDGKRITVQEMDRAVDYLIDHHGSFPRISAIIAAARPPSSHEGTRDESQEPVGDQLDREEVSLRQWMRKFEMEGNQDGAAETQRRIDKLWRMRANRQITSKLRRDEGSLFGSTGTPVYQRDWDEQDLIGPTGVSRGYPNNVSRHAAALVEGQIRDRFGEREVQVAREFGLGQRAFAAALDFEIGAREARAIEDEESNPFL